MAAIDAAFTESIARVERDLLWAHGGGMAVPDYVVRAFRKAIEATQERRERRETRAGHRS